MAWKGMKRSALLTLRDQGEQPLWNLYSPKDGRVGRIVPELEKLIDQGLIESGVQEWPEPSEHRDAATWARVQTGTICYRLTAAGRTEADKIKS
jgi:hypothetical protein